MKPSKNRKENLKMTLSRRNFMKGAAIGIAGVASAGILSGCSETSGSAAVSAAATETPTPSASAEPAAAEAPAEAQTVGNILNPQDESFTSYTTNYSHIFSPLKIGGVTLKNRIVKSAAGSEMQKTSTLWPDPEAISYYTRFGEGETGMVCFESSTVIPTPVIPGADAAIAMPAGIPEGVTMVSLDISTDEGIPGHKAIADAMHAVDTPIIAQMYDMTMLSGASSTITENYNLESSFNSGKMQTTEEVQTEIQNFIDGAERYYKAGFDGVEINCSCNHYFSTYLSRRINKERTDQYSGESIENRCRIVCEIIEGIRKRVGNDFIIQILYSGIEEDVVDLGKNSECTTVDEAIEFAKLFEKAGASSLHIRSEAYGHHCGGFMPDVLHIPDHGYTGYGSYIQYGKHMPEVLGEYDGIGALIEVAAKIKQNVSIPVGAVGSMDPRMAPDLLDNAIADGKLDFLLMTRPLMADFFMPKKLKEGRREDVAPCTHCMTCFVAPIDMGTPMYCRVNAALSRAFTEDMPEGYDPLPTKTPRNVMVIGGGPAGMEAARIAAERGHTVTLYEEKTNLGGRLPALQTLKGSHERIMDHVEYLKHELDVQNVQVVTGKKVDAAFIAGEKPDTVVVAVGSTPDPLQGLISGGSVINMDDVLEELEAQCELNVAEEVVLVGAQFQACELAIHLCKHQKKVIMLNPGPESQFYMNAATWPREMGKSWLYAQGVKVYHNANIEQISSDSVTFDTEYGVKKTISGVTVINAMPENTNRSLFEEAKSACEDVYAVGNCYAAGTIANATARANIIARRIGNEQAGTQQNAAGENTYTSTATGIGDVTVSIQVEDGKIVKATVDTSNETANIGRGLGEQFASQIVEKGSIDAVSQATVTSNAVSTALQDCLRQAGLLS
jgi:2,4-dienoyl-CoA reductase-like NADH-dependent reductase (Old Yellow Enzyme family)/thioredoxin reductase